MAVLPHITGVGLTAFDEGIVGMLPASARGGHLRAILVTLERLKLGQKTNVAKPMHQLASSITKRGMVVLISDLLDVSRIAAGKLRLEYDRVDLAAGCGERRRQCRNRTDRKTPSPHP